MRNKFGKKAIPNTPSWAVGGKVLCKGFLPEFVAYPTHWEIVPIKAELGRENAIGKHSDACKNEGGGGYEGEDSFHIFVL